MITFISQLDIREVYQFVNFFPFLIDEDELQKLDFLEQQDKFQYKLQDDHNFQRDSDISSECESDGSNHF